ncbi:2-oxoglutarate dehydrogenase complex dihydrolipoyllysine-residue succinyltransferase [Puniceicoccus vermicola]|uniref:Dihydrolipoyllysine-residue succinyltransferase component of 2-oxoglutarate dehydrogenase complex n=1 Tax=Puniceicoccus vermicola TaxID=388746 RepID=A0A7X1E606_9BACT|nr:2-oxoglutarate dehydrogenase complex dihydrolipoyllysine-residue succinyltransferase [Puniceicoccus vermicola]MBC2603618.1 2-oxoglutarate dehydrogenase complex dihydrolipoyllysine-residue succinyltransferase [Puniceicoccus vermicola]
MAIEVKVPALGESISSGILAGWQVKDGDIVEKDQVLYELETDKITSEGTAEAAGKISLKADEGDEVEIGQVIAEIDESAAGDSGSSEASEKETAEKDSEPAPEKETTDSPAVRRISEESGLDSAEVEGTGKGGRVTKGDMLSALEKKESAPEKSAPSKASAPAAKSEPKPTGDRPETRKKMSPLRRSIAQRLVSVQNESAILTTFNEVDMSAVMGLRKKYQDDFVKKHGIKLGFMSFFVKAVVEALKNVPGLNARLEGEELVQNHYYDIGVAVSTEKGLMVPVLRDCDQKSFSEIEQDLGDYAKKAREGKIQIDDLQGGVFSITNGGVFGSLLSTPIINPPQSGILGMHSIQQRPIAVDGQVVIRPMMYLAVSYDHRIVDGKEAVSFLVSIKNSIEDPARMLFGA